MNNRDKHQLMCDIRTYSFAVLEAALFLDTHPRSRCALEYYEKYNTLLKGAKAEYEDTYGPLTIFGGSSDECWSWVESPWPWEYEANCRL
ncbi:MAG: spore coat protein CotJB [Clostridia bacterium]|nr:spore coat protein CotJB [Clostridia bacterium]